MRSLFLVAMLGCSSKPTPAPAPSNTQAPGPPVVAIVPDAAPDAAAEDEPPYEEPQDLPCEPRTEGWKAGLHDRYLFRDEQLELQGYKNKAGDIVIKPRFLDAYPFGPGGIAAVTDQAGGFGFIDPSGTMIAIAHRMDNGPDYFQDKLARVIGKNKKVGYIDGTGTIVIPPTYDEAMPFCNGTAEVVLRGKKLTIDKTGAVVTKKP